MEIITVHTTQNIDIDYEIGGIGERVLARLIDFAILIPLLIAFAVVSSILSETGDLIFACILLGIYTFYDLVCEVFFNGQSIGKRVMKIRVISLDGSRPSFSQYLLRWLFRIVDFSLTFQLCGLITAFSTKNCQRVGDIVAGTALVRAVPRTKIDNIIFSNVEEAYQPVFQQVSQLGDSDIALIHEVVESYFRTGSSMVHTMADKVRTHLSLSLPPGMNDIKFLQTVLKDYSHIAASVNPLTNS
jgi:uncharacterized RDD family membrane protein YckC